MEKNLKKAILKRVTLKGIYVDLLPLEMNHAEEMSLLAAENRSTFGLTKVPDGLADTKDYIRQALENYQDNRELPFAIFERASGKLAGASRLMNIEFWIYPPENPFFRPFSIPHTVEIGHTWLGERYQRTGINTDAKIQLLSYVFEEWKVERVTLKTDERNSRSRANIERVGAKLDGILRAHMPSWDGKIRNTAMYSILKTEWPDIKMKLQARLR